MAEETRTSSPLLILLAWAIVVIPAGWGLTYTIQNATKLFNPAPAAPAPAAPSAAPSSSVAAPK